MINLQMLMPPDWAAMMSDEFSKQRFASLENRLGREYEQYQDQIQPTPDRIFRALSLTPLEQVKVVILGQDPYQTAGLAQGLAFSIPKEIKPGWRAFPSSLRNISKALILDGSGHLHHGDLTSWAQQGVLLLNASLTVRLELAASHADIGWQEFTDCLIGHLAQSKPHVAWLLWGSHAQRKADLIRASGKEHFILEASHPSGLSVYKTKQPFIYPGDEKSCDHFRMVNEYMRSHGRAEINWSIDE